MIAGCQKAGGGRNFVIIHDISVVADKKSVITLGASTRIAELPLRLSTELLLDTTTDRMKP